VADVTIKAKYEESVTIPLNGKHLYQRNYLREGNIQSQ
jgi:hypothetical protein